MCLTQIRNNTLWSNSYRNKRLPIKALSYTNCHNTPTLSPLRMNFQVMSLRKMQICIYKSSHMLVHMSEAHWHVHAFFKSGCASCTLLYSPIQDIVVQYLYFRASLVAQLVKNPPAMQETLIRFLGQEDPLEKGSATHSGILGLPWWLSW